MGETDRVRLCAHCLRQMRGFAAINDDWLCHPDEGMDCYGLVTIYGHPRPCENCSSMAAAIPCGWCGSLESDGSVAP